MSLGTEQLSTQLTGKAFGCLQPRTSRIVGSDERHWCTSCVCSIEGLQPDAQPQMTLNLVQKVDKHY